jgi:undecaprenyl-diphosphatase
MTLAKTVWNFIENRDHRVMHRMNQWKAPRWIRFWMLTATRLGDGWIWHSLAAIVLLVGGPPRYAAVGASMFAALTGVVVFKLLKTLSRRKRPCQLEPHCWAKILPPDQFSFPSGHTMTAFSIALVLSFFYPSLEGPMYFLAISIGVSRVVLGMHFLSDVLAGAALGSALGLASIVTFAAYRLI